MSCSQNLPDINALSGLKNTVNVAPPYLPQQQADGVNKNDTHALDFPLSGPALHTVGKTPERSNPPRQVPEPISFSLHRY